MEMLERILRPQQESEMDECPRAFAISDIQRSPVGIEPIITVIRRRRLRWYQGSQGRSTLKFPVQSTE